MTQLKTQPTAWPTRKLIAVIIAGAVVGGVQAALDLLWPDHPFRAVMTQADSWIQLLVMAVAGYVTKERADVQ